ncbi:MAG TPA: RNA polymerase sigma factor [Steroidobacteraceae bacterium]|nr:RNA polymerase sigma factor [Steroidobacteraceae bacterium]
MGNANTTRDPRADALLAIRCQLGERDAFDALIARWHEPLWRYLRTLASSSEVADDLSQDTWLRVLRSIAALRDASRLRPWLFGIARRVAMDRLRFRYAHPTADLAEIDDMAAAEADIALESDLATLQSALDALPVSDRETLTLFYLRELTIEQIATLLQAPTGTIKSRLFRARELLRRELDTGAHK